MKLVFGLAIAALLVGLSNVVLAEQQGNKRGKELAALGQKMRESGKG